MRSTTSVTFSNSHRAPDEVITTFKVTICSCLPSSTLSLLSFLSCHLSLITPLSLDTALILLPHHFQQYFFFPLFPSPLPLYPCSSFHPSPLTSNSPPLLLLPTVSSALLYIMQHSQEFLCFFARELLRYLQYQYKYTL